MSEITEQLTLIEEALEFILEYRDGGMPEVFSHLKHHITHGLTKHLRDSWQRTKDRANIEQNKEGFESSARALNAAHKEYQAHKESGNIAGMHAAQQNINTHKANMRDYHSSLKNAGISASIKPKAQPQKPQVQAKQQAQTQSSQQAQPQSQANSGANWSQKFKQARQSGNKSQLRALKDQYNKQQRAAAGTANEAWDLAESLILDLLEDMKNRENKAIITKKEIIKNGKPHVKGEFIRTEIIKDAKKDIPDVQREMICAKASRKAEGMGAKIKREVSQELRKDLGI